MHLNRRPFTTKLPANGPDVLATKMSSAIVAVEAMRP
jgi:hypothetical protein